jgi:hypothetical protein
MSQDNSGFSPDATLDLWIAPGDQTEIADFMTAHGGRQPTPDELRAWTRAKRVNPAGGSGDAEGRDGYCTPKWLADLIGPVDLDPCSNERSHIQAAEHYYGPGSGDCGLELGPHVSPNTTVFINPPYGKSTTGGGTVKKWVDAYKHTRFIFLLRFDPSTAWFDELIKTTNYLWFPSKQSAESRISFEPPPGVKTSSNPFPHALYLRERPNFALAAAGRVLVPADFTTD